MLSKKKTQLRTIKRRIRDSFIKMRKHIIRSLPLKLRRLIGSMNLRIGKPVFMGVIKPSTMYTEHRKIEKQNDKPAHQGYREMARRRGELYVRT